MVDTAFLDRLAEGVSEFNAGQARGAQMDYETYEATVLDPYEALLEEAQSRGMRKLGEGESRMVFTAGSTVPSDAVVKVSLTDGTRQNRTEVEHWQEFDTAMRQCVAPLVEWRSDYRWVVQRKAASAHPKHVETVRERLHDAGWACSDLRTENIGLVDGRPVLRDFGIVTPR